MSLLLSAVDDWAETLNRRLSTHSVFIDFAKAFDSVPHERLLIKLESIGIRGPLLQWFCAFLTSRRQRVVINGHFSNWCKVSSGVPQGSILGPLLFILYINDISSVVKNSDIKIFADDVTLYKTIRSTEDCEALQADLDSICDWCNLWQMRLNPSKCEALCISNKHLPITFNYQLEGCSLKWSLTVKYLGVILNTKLTWNDQCTYVVSKATRMLNLLRRNLFACSSAAKNKAFRSLVIPVLEYASQVWNPYTQKNVTKLESVQLRAARWVAGSRFNRHTLKWSKSSLECRSHLNWPELSIRRQYLSMLTVYDILHQRIALKFSDYFSFTSSCTRSHSLSIHCKSSSVNSYRYSFFVNSIFLWNQIQESILHSPKRNQFKHRLYLFLTT